MISEQCVQDLETTYLNGQKGRERFLMAQSDVNKKCRHIEQVLWIPVVKISPG